MRLSRRFVVGAYLSEPEQRNATLEPGVLGDRGYLQARVTDVGAALAWSPTARFHVGLRASVTHLRLQGLLQHSVSDGDVVYVGMASAQDRATGDAGVQYEISDSTTLGLSFVQGARWNVGRTSVSTLAGPLPSRTFQFSSPSRVGGGFSTRVGPQVLVSTEVDYVFLNQLRQTFQVVSGPFQPPDYLLDGGFDLRVGVEASFPRGSFSFQLRAGVDSPAPGAFRFIGVQPASEAQAFPGISRTGIVTFGGSLVTRSLRFDLGGALGGARAVGNATVGVRF